MPDRWRSARAVFARRNVIEHDASRADRGYLDLLDDLDGLPALGDRLDCDRAYVEQAIASLGAVADVFTVGFGAHLAPRTAELAKLSEEPVYGALRAGRHLAARWMGVRALDALDEGHDHNELLVNVWIEELRGLRPTRRSRSARRASSSAIRDCCSATSRRSAAFSSSSSS